MQHLQYKLTQAGIKDTLEGLALTDSTIMMCALATIWNSEHVQQNINFSKAKWKQDDAKYKDK